MPFNIQLATRFRGFLPVVIDVETAGFNSEKDALLEVAAVMLDMDEYGKLFPAKTHTCHILPFHGANLDPAALEFNGIDPHHPLRFAVSEYEAADIILEPIVHAVKRVGCQRAILVGHNPSFDLAFIKAWVNRIGYLDNPFHSFTTFDTATLSGLALGQTVLAKAVQQAGMEFDASQAHSAIYDAERTAELFCYIVNRWRELEQAVSKE